VKNQVSFWRSGAARAARSRLPVANILEVAGVAFKPSTSCLGLSGRLRAPCASCADFFPRQGFRLGIFTGALRFDSLIYGIIKKFVSMKNLEAIFFFLGGGGSRTRKSPSNSLSGKELNI